MKTSASLHRPFACFPPFPRFHETPLPNACLKALCILLNVGIGTFRELGPIKRVTVTNKPSCQVLTVNILAGRYDSSVLISIALSTYDGLSIIEITGQLHRADLAASIFVTGCILARLSTLRSVDAPYSDALTMNFNCIGIDDRCSPR